MDRPTTAKIGALDYQILWMPTTWENERRSLGECAPDVQEIRISERITGKLLACVFAHEVAHAITQYMGYWYDAVDSEHQANVASYGMVMFWRDNPAILRWWVSLIEV